MPRWNRLIDVGTIESPCKSQFSTHGERTEGPPLANSQPFIRRTRVFGEKFRLSSRPLLLCHIWKLVPPDVTHVINFTRLPLFSHATLKRSGSLGTRLTNCLIIHACTLSTNQSGVNFLFVNFEYVESKLGLNHKPTV